MKKILKSILVLILFKLSALVLKKYNPKIIAITGTVGKTSTKDAVYVALSQFESVRKSPKSFNSEFGIPLAILDADNPGGNLLGWVRVLVEGIILLIFPNHYPRWLVLEVGTDRPGDIQEITRWLSPDVVIVTKLSKVPVHVEAFGSPEYLFEEKGNLVKALKSGGILILNADDDDVVAYRNISKDLPAQPGKVVLFGNSTGSDVSALNHKIIYNEEGVPTGVSFEVLVAGHEDLPLKVELEGTLGEQHSYHILAALSLIKVLGENLTIAVKSFKNESASLGRMKLIEGVNDSIIIDDTYNSSPVAVEEALKTLKSIKLSTKEARKIAILGDMLELGLYTAEAHKKVGKDVSKIVQILATVGIRSRYTAESALNEEMDEANIFQFDDSLEVGKFMGDLIKKGDIILIKGSQGVRMERVVESLMAHPEQALKLLVRQDGIWQNK